MRGDNDRDGASSITSHFAHVSHCFFYLKVMDDWQTQNKSVGCIQHLQSVDMQVVEAYE